MSRYRKIDTRIWNDKKFSALSNDAKFVLLLVLTHPNMTALGAMRANAQGMAAEIAWHFDKFNHAFSEIISMGIIKFDEKASFLWLPNFLKYNKPESPNVIRGWVQSLDLLPECDTKETLILGVSTYVKKLSPAFQKALPEAFRKSMPNQEQEQEQEQEQDSEIQAKDKNKGKNTHMSGKKMLPVDNSSFSRERKKIFSENGADEQKQNHPNWQSLAGEVLTFLNQKTGKAYRAVDENIKIIIAVLKAGHSVDDCRQVIAKKTREWRDNARMAQYLRPATLFNPTKFAQYVGELVMPDEI